MVEMLSAKYARLARQDEKGKDNLAAQFVNRLNANWNKEGKTVLYLSRQVIKFRRLYSSHRL